MGTETFTIQTAEKVGPILVKLAQLKGDYMCCVSQKSSNFELSFQKFANSKSFIISPQKLQLKDSAPVNKKQDPQLWPVQQIYL